MIQVYLKNIYKLKEATVSSCLEEMKVKDKAMIKEDSKAMITEDSNANAKCCISVNQLPISIT